MIPMANELYRSKSPYLREHAGDPVEWREWTPDALAYSRRIGKPIFLSIGYSACHWCHVMQAESFKDEEVARILNSKFVPIKVDREEHPEIDSKYMDVCIAEYGSGGWPLTVVLTPGLDPIFVGTYIPKDDRMGMRGIKSVLDGVYSAWKAGTIEKIQVYNRSTEHGIGVIDEALFGTAFSDMLSIFDRRYGGFGAGPKFPMPTYLSYMLMYWRKYGNPYALAAVEITLTRIRQGGIFDQLGGGVHRYSTDAYWIVPHFEKMLYDQALLCSAYAWTYKATGQQFYLDAAKEIADFVISDMYCAGKGFMTSIDADYNGVEGGYYLIGYDEMRSVLTDEEMDIAEKHFGISKEGNFDTGINILYIKQNIQQIAGEDPSRLAHISDVSSTVRGKLLEHRKRRAKPNIDDKVLADQNGMVVSALCDLYSACQERKYLDVAIDVANAFDPKALMHAYRDGNGYTTASIDDYAHMALAMLGLYQVSCGTEYADKAESLCDSIISKFCEKESRRLHRFESDEWNSGDQSRDAVVPSGISTAIRAMFILSRVTGKARYEEVASEALEKISGDIISEPVEHSSALVTAMCMSKEFYEIVLSEGNDGMFERLSTELRGSFLPDACLAYNKIGKNNIEVAGMMPPVNGRSSIYVCTGSYCSKAVFNTEDALHCVNNAQTNPFKS